MSVVRGLCGAIIGMYYGHDVINQWSEEIGSRFAGRFGNHRFS
jgi:hypothetical protein